MGFHRCLMRPLPVFVLLIATASASSAQDRLQIITGVDESGRATALWQEMIRKHSPDRFPELEHLTKPFTATEAAWVRLIQSRRQQWETEIPNLASPFRPIASPDARIVVGNRGGDDAFTHDPHTIGFDLDRIHQLYGDADSTENTALIDRFFRHEYTHLLQKAWLREHPLPMETPLQSALADMWTEGMGNYYSLSASWRTIAGKPSAKSVETLQVLEPRFVTRLAAIACATPEHAGELSKGLSSGPFDLKWGALPVALWLERESANPEFMRVFVTSGTDGVWKLASRHLSPALRPQVDEIRSLEKTCGRAK
jgi:hypothetical protein